MPRKPSSVFVIVQPQAAQTATPGVAQMPTQAYRYPLADDSSIDDVVAANFHTHPAGTRIFVVEDTKVDAYTVGVRLEPVDDPRLEEDLGA